MNEWDAYRINIPKEGDRLSGVSYLEEVYHVVHPPEARRILEQKKIRAGIIYDESKLNKSRTHVVWLSANRWAPGSIYGTVEFTFPWQALIDGRRFYWVEDMSSYSPPAYRILLTDKDLTSMSMLKPYDPVKDEGPLRCRADIWYWNHEKTSEFLFDGDIDLSVCTNFQGTSHRPNRCRMHKSGCTELVTPPYVTSARIISFLLSHNIHSVDHVFKDRIPPEIDRPLSFEFDHYINGIWLAFVMHKNAQFDGEITELIASKAIVRGALALYGADRGPEARKLTRLLKNEKVFQLALEALVNDHFEMANWKYS